MGYGSLMRRPLPTEAEAREILARRRTRPVPRPTPRAGKALSSVIRDLDQKYGRGVQALEPRWAEIVGEQDARITRPIKLTRGRGTSGGVLELRVPGAAALLVQHKSADILARVNLFLGAGTVERLRITQGPIRPLSSVSVARPVPPPPLPAAVEAELKASLEQSPEPIREALLRLGRAVLGEDRTRRR